ncbi:MAG: Mut7-C RNAse domain-containing protein [Anaerolineales bacterium]|nr:Mut7-C RNAse domain-containing protein [Anaerolineales bacterium]
MKLLLDGMLGRLAKWLRLLGYDTTYFPDLDDNELVRLSRAQGRILLTRDRELTRRRRLTCLLVENDELEEQIQQVISELNLETERPFSRCPVCNTPLQEVEKPSVKGHVPPYVFQIKEHFNLCPECNRIYWRGTHWAKMRQVMARIREEQ